MWIWWMVSFVILISCMIFAYRMIISTYEFLPADKRFFPGFNKDSILSSGNSTQKNILKALKTKVQSVEDNTTFYEIQFSKFQQRLKTLEDQFALKSLQTVKSEDEENWKELFYEENSSKEKLENELDFTKQALENLEFKLSELDGKTNNSIELQSNHDMRLNDMQSLNDNINLLQRQLDASLGREKELEQLLFSEITVREKYSLLQQENIQLASEADDLRRRCEEMNKMDIDHQAAKRHQWQLESLLSICKDENSRLKNDFEKLTNQNLNP